MNARPIEIGERRLHNGLVATASAVTARRVFFVIEANGMKSELWLGLVAWRSLPLAPPQPQKGNQS